MDEMCNSVLCDGVKYDTPRALADLVGGQDHLIWQDRNPFRPWPEGKDWKDLDLCLCPIDLAATLAKAGLNYHRGDDPMEWFVSLRP
jgi:hypothetical protein